MTEEPQNRENNRNPDGTFKEGFSGNPGGRPKGTMKDYLRRKFMEMTDEQKELFLNSVSAEMQIKLAEGNPANNTDITTGGKPIYLPPELLAKNDLDKDDNSSSSPKPDSQ